MLKLSKLSKLSKPSKLSKLSKLSELSKLSKLHKLRKLSKLSSALPLSLSLSLPLLHPVCSCAVRLLAQDLPVPSGARYDCCHSAWGLSAGQIAIGAKGGITICIYRTASLSHYVKCASTAGAMASALRGSRMPVNDLSDSSGLPLDASLPTLLLSFFATTGSPRYCLEGAPLLQSMALCASATEHECR